MTPCETYTKQLESRHAAGNVGLFLCTVYMLMCAMFFLRPHNVAGAPSFTTRGFKYYHLFNLSLCGDKYEEAVCSSNISLSTGKSVSNI